MVVIRPQPQDRDLKLAYLRAREYIYIRIHLARPLGDWMPLPVSRRQIFLATGNATTGL